jgi:hypothetical protein
MSPPELDLRSPNASEISIIMHDNMLETLKYSIRRRHCLNHFNTALIYLFHIIQAAGIVTTTVAAGYEIKWLVWLGAALNIMATLIHIFEKTNVAVSASLLTDINRIIQGNFIDESMITSDQITGLKKGNTLKTIYDPSMLADTNVSTAAVMPFGGLKPRKSTLEVPQLELADLARTPSTAVKSPERSLDSGKTA